MLNTINERIKIILDVSDISQSEFARKIKVTPAYIWKIINKSDSTPSERLIEDICTKFGVNEVWLRTGEGGTDNMFTSVNSDDRFSLNLGKLASTQNKLVENMINAIAETDPDKLHIIEEFMKKCLNIE